MKYLLSIILMCVWFCLNTPCYSQSDTCQAWKPYEVRQWKLSQGDGGHLEINKSPFFYKSTTYDKNGNPIMSFLEFDAFSDSYNKISTFNFTPDWRKPLYSTMFVEDKKAKTTTTVTYANSGDVIYTEKRREKERSMFFDSLGKPTTPDQAHALFAKIVYPSP